jgi:hypothetical protein
LGVRSGRAFINQIWSSPEVVVMPSRIGTGLSAASADAAKADATNKSVNASKWTGFIASSQSSFFLLPAR